MKDRISIIFFSPHLDDVAFSCGPLVREFSERGFHCVVATCFSGSKINPSGFGLKCQTDKGISKKVDYMKLRRLEDEAWAASLCANIDLIHGPFVEAPHRGYDSLNLLFGELKIEKNLQTLTHDWIDHLLETFSTRLVFCPKAVGGHVDHKFLKSALEEQQRDKGFKLFYYLDQPYFGRIEKGGFPLIGDSLTKTYYFEDFWIRNALKAATCYHSQLGFQFGGVQPAVTFLSDAWAKGISISAGDSCASFSMLDRDIPVMGP